MSQKYAASGGSSGSLFRAFTVYRCGQFQRVRCAERKLGSAGNSGAVPLAPAVGNFMHRNGHERRGPDHAAAVYE